MRDLCCGKKKMLKNKVVKVISIPYYDGLSIKDMINWTQDQEGGKILDYVPSFPKELLKMPRAYIGNILNTVLG